MQQKIIHFEPLTKKTYEIYMDIGSKAYNQHYTHLWPNGQSSPYIKSSFTSAVLEKEAENPNTQLFLIQKGSKPVGILKITLHKALKNYTDKKALYIDKIYILKEATGTGIGKKVMRFITLRAKELDKEIVWLDAMQKGPALQFYLSNGFKIHGEKNSSFFQIIEEEKPMYTLVKKVDQCYP